LLKTHCRAATTTSFPLASPVDAMGTCYSLPLASEGRAFTANDAKGGDACAAAESALVLIGYQNEFTTKGGKLHDAVKDVMQDTKMLENTAKLCVEARAKGVKIFHVPITLQKNMSDNPNKRRGIRKGCANGGLFVENTWNSTFCEALAPQQGDIVVAGNQGLDAFPGTNLEELLLKHDAHTVAVGGFLTNCCVESTVRTAFAKGFNVVSLTDCTACTSAEGQKVATEDTLGMFSAPMTSTAFLDVLK